MFLIVFIISGLFSVFFFNCLLEAQILSLVTQKHH